MTDYDEDYNEHDDYDDDEYSNSYSDEDVPDYQPEMGAYGPNGRVGFIGVGPAPKNRREQAMLNPLDRFRLYVDSIARNLSQMDGISIDQDGIQTMLDNAENLNDVKYKNPTAYVLGFLVTAGGRRFDKKDFDYVVQKVLPKVKGGSVLPPDIVRYARLWNSLLSK